MRQAIPLVAKIAVLVVVFSAIAFLSLTVSFWPKDYFWIERKNAVMPVWVRGNIDSGVFVVFNHNTYVEDLMGDTIKIFDRILSSVRASFLSPFNGFTYYTNNKRTNDAEVFMDRIAFDSSMTDVVHRLRIPTLLVYGKSDLIAPVGVGEFIYDEIGTAKADKSFLVLGQSRHGAEKGDVEIMQKAIIEFIDRNMMD